MNKNTTTAALLRVDWNITGRTRLRTTPRRNGLDWRQPPKGGATGYFTYRKTWRIARAKARAVGKAAERGCAYFITHTMDPQHDMHERRKRFRMLVECLRKLDPVCYVWTTEYHGGNGDNAGTIHHHMVIVFSSPWWYRNVVQRWSYAYCLSSNGLDVQRVYGNAARYVTKYITKEAFTEPADTLRIGDPYNRLPFRWWSAAGIPSDGTTLIDLNSVLLEKWRTPWHSNEYLWTEPATTVCWAAELAWANFTKQPQLPRGPCPSEGPQDL